MNGQEFHLFNATVDLFNPSETNCLLKKAGKLLLLRLIRALRVHSEQPAGEC